MTIIITLKDGKDISFTDESDLRVSYRKYAENNFMEAFWDSPNWSEFEAGCGSNIAKCLSAVSKRTEKGADSEKLKTFIYSLTGKKAESGVVLKTVADYLNTSECTYFWHYNKLFIEKMLGGILWDSNNARMFYEFLLLHLQLNLEIIGTGKYSGFLKCEEEMLKNKLYHAERKTDNMYSDGNGGIYYLCEDGIHRAKYNKDDTFDFAEKICVFKEMMSESSNKRIRSFAICNGNVFIVIYADGQMETPDKDIIGIWEENGSPLLQAVVSYGELWQLLTEDGRIISNVERFGTDLKAVTWIGAGLNCLSAIAGSNRELVTTEETIKIRDSKNCSYTDVRIAGARAERNLEKKWCGRWFLIDEYNNMQYFDAGFESPKIEEDVSIASICDKGIYYIKGTDLWEYSFKTKTNRAVLQGVCGTNEEIKGLFCENIGSAARVFYWPKSQEHPNRITCR